MNDKRLRNVPSPSTERRNDASEKSGSSRSVCSDARPPVVATGPGRARPRGTEPPVGRGRALDQDVSGFEPVPASAAPRCEVDGQGRIATHHLEAGPGRESRERPLDEETGPAIESERLKV